ncbi:unnamed protein product [Chironomus riparius]|uniref:FXNA-like protease n=1 Tax=Chironomus riparius TaxID=315576 RepID=A0A9N9RLC2_9DIPT|nr:unnamed protein product [Chironomus riparius]
MLMAEIYSLFFLAYIVALGFLSNYFLHRLDTKALLKSQEERYPGSFIAERAYQQLKILNDFGPKVVGSKANEILAADFVFSEANNIQKNATNPDDIEIDRQIESGFSYYDNYYNLQNIVVRIQGETDHAVMLNCHFDSVPGSPGASDDIVNCCVMMEIYRVLSQSPIKQRHTIIFLFNGSEETGLQAAHAFITQQKWRKNVRAYINLESTGSGGKEILFRTGPKHDWLVKMYRESVPRPFGQVASEELFESGAIPSATDFQIFRDYGDVPGLDFAYVEDGWRYHTRYDNIDYITIESVQHTGNNILALTKKIANSKELSDPPEGTYSIYFEYLGLVFVSYSATAGAIFNYIISILAFAIPFMLQTKFKMENLGFVIFETIMSLVTIIISILLATLACWGMASLMNSVDNTMSWFNTTFLSIGIYCSLALIVQIATYHAMQLLGKCFFRTKKYRETSMRHRVKINLNGVTMFWSLLTITLTAMGMRIGYIFMVLLFVSLCTYLLTYSMCRVLSKTTSQSWIFVHVFGHSVVFLFLCYISIQILLLFIPIAAKQYYENPDILVAIICVLWMVMCMSYFIPLTLFIKLRAVLYCSLLTLFVTCTILAFTSLGFPYSDAQHAPRLQRFRTTHIKRTIYDPAGNEKSSIGNMMIYAWDRNGIRTLKEAFNGHDFLYIRNDELCSEYYLCAFQHRAINERVIAIKGFHTKPNIDPTAYKLIKATSNGGVVEIEFALELRTTVELSLTLDEGLEFESSNIDFTKIDQNQKRHIITTITVGVSNNDTYLIKIQLKGTPISNIFASLVVVTIDSTFDQGAKTTEFAHILNKFPDYTFSYVHQVDSSVYEIAQK